MAGWRNAPVMSGGGDELDVTTGAPASVRAAVGAARDPVDRLATLRQIYPDAQPYGDGNFVFRAPDSGRRTLYNEENPRVFGMVPIPTLGDAVSMGPALAEALGGIVGGAGAAAAAPATLGGSAFAIPAGVGLGAAAGRELYGDAARYLLGTQDSRSVPSRLSDAAMTAGVNAVGQRVGDLAGQAAKVAVSSVGKHARDSGLPEAQRISALAAALGL